MVQDFKKLTVYQIAYDLSLEIYKELKDVKTHYWVTNQLFRASTSICANLTEMAAFENKNQQKQKLLICIGETNETEF